MPKLRIAMLTHSVNPRGGVVHALQLAEAMQRLGHDVTLIAAAEAGKDFFRRCQCRTLRIPLPVLSDDLTTSIGQRIQAYIDYFSENKVEPYDIYHAQDAISGCAAAELVKSGLIPDFVRTVHHLDHFNDAALMAWQHQSFTRAQQVFCVSKGWTETLKCQYGIAAIHINNGVDTQRFQPEPEESDKAIQQQLGLTRSGPLFLAVGGVEARKNTLGIFRAFCEVLKTQAVAQLLIIGGASLLDHSNYRQAFDLAVSESGVTFGPGQALIITGPLPDATMTAVFRLADGLVFPSLIEGFGLVVLEAIASGTPVIVSNRSPFTEYLQAQDCLWVNPENPAAIAEAMRRVTTTFTSDELQTITKRLSTEFSWDNTALVHVTTYQTLLKTRGTTYA